MKFKICLYIVIAGVILNSFSTVLAAKTAIFEDDFNYDIGQWQTIGYSYPSVNFSVQGGTDNPVGKIICDKTESTGVRYSVIGSPPLESNDYEYSLKIKPDSACEYVMILFRMNSQTELYGIWYEKYQKKIYIVKNGITKKMENYVLPISEAGFKENSWNDILIKTIGNRFEIYINNTSAPAFSITDNDSPNLTGGVGLCLYTGQPAVSTLEFDDVMVTINDDSTGDYFGGDIEINNTGSDSLNTAASFLVNLGIMDVENNLFKPEQYISRGMFAKIITNAINFRQVKTSEGNVAEDVPAEYQYFGEIKELIDLKFMSLDNNGMFRPDEPIIYTEAIAVVMRVLGYEKLCEINGGFPMGYIQQADEIKISKNITVQQDYIMTAANVALLLYNAMNTPLMSMSAIKGYVTEYETGTETWLSKYYDIYKDKGVVEANENVGLKGDKCASRGQIRINHTEYLCAATKAYEYVGYNTLFYYCNDDNAGKYLVYIEKDDNKELKIYTDDIISFNNNSYQYQNKEKQQKINISTYVDVIFNGKCMAGNGYIPVNGYIEVIDNDKNGTYDVLKITDFMTVNVSSVDLENGIIYDKEDYKKNINLKKSGQDINYIIKNTDGKKIRLSKINADAVVSAAMSEDGETGELIVSTKMITGEIKSYNSIDEIVCVNGENYNLVHEFKDKNNIKYNVKTRAHLTYDNKIAYIKYDIGDLSSVAYIVKFYTADDGLEENVIIKYFNLSSNDVESSQLENTVYIDNKKIKNNKDIINAITLKFNECATISQQNNAIDSSVAIKNGSLAIIKCNADNKICSIDFPCYSNLDDENQQKGMKFISGIDTYDSDKEIRYKEKLTLFGNNFRVSNQTPVIIVPEDRTRYDLYKTTKVGNYFKDDKTYSVVGYSLNGDKHDADIVVCFDNKPNKDAAPVLVKSVNQCISDNNITYVVNGYSQNKEVSYEVSTEDLYSGDKHELDSGVSVFYSRLYEEIEKLQFGDLVRFFYSDDKKISGIYSKIYNAKNNSVLEFGISGYSWRSFVGYLYSFDNDTLTVTTDDVTAMIAGQTPKNFDVSTECKSVYRVDLAGKEIYEADLKNMCTYNQSGALAAKLLVIQYYSENRLIIIYE